MALGVPCVAPEAAGPGEIICNGRTGLLYGPGNAAEAAGLLRRLLSDQALAGEIGAAGRADVEGRFPAERMGEEFARLYRELA